MYVKISRLTSCMNSVPTVMYSSASSRMDTVGAKGLSCLPKATNMMANGKVIYRMDLER